MAALHEINLAVTSSLDLDDVLQHFLDKITELFPHFAVTIRLVDRHTGLLEPLACCNLDEQLWKATLPVDGGVQITGSHNPKEYNGLKIAVGPSTIHGKEIQKLRTIADTLAGSILKRAAEGRTDGVAVIAEGVVLDIDPEDLQQLKDVERDEIGRAHV